MLQSSAGSLMSQRPISMLHYEMSLHCNLRFLVSLRSVAEKICLNTMMDTLTLYWFAAKMKQQSTPIESIPTMSPSPSALTRWKITGLAWIFQRGNMLDTALLRGVLSHDITLPDQ